MARYGSGGGYGVGGGSAPTEDFMESLVNDESVGARTIFVGNLDVRVTRKMLFELMVQAGPVEAIRIVPPRDNIPRTISFVRYEHAVSVRYALLVFRDVKLFRSSLTLNYSGPNKARPRPDYPPNPITFFEIPRGFAECSDQTKTSMAKGKFISDPAEYDTGYYPPNEDDDYSQQERSYPGRNGPDRDSRRGRERFEDDRADHDQGRSSHRKGRGGSRPSADSVPRRQSQHIRFDDSYDHRADRRQGHSPQQKSQGSSRSLADVRPVVEARKHVGFSDKADDSRRRDEKTLARTVRVTQDEDGGVQNHSPRQSGSKKSKKKRKEHGSSSAKRKRAH